jgi:hypothetical protein
MFTGGAVAPVPARPGGSVMNRKEFLKTIGAVGLSAGAGALFAKPCWSSEAAGGTAFQGHSCSEKAEFAEGYVTRLLDIIDNQLDLREKDRLMKANGRACARNYINGSGRKIRTKSVEEFVAVLRKSGGGEAARLDGNVIHFQFMKNYQGFDAPEGTCLCPLVESKPEGLSKTYCLCSVGYVQDMFQTHLGRPVEVELLESALGGGKRCRFRIEVT